MAYDLAITGGLIVDGSGLPRFRGDVAIKNGRIAAVGKLDQPARRTIDATDLVVAPGFIDHHTHLDAQLFWDPLGTYCCYHGVTTVIFGNCGLGLAPCRAGDQDALIGLVASVEDMPRPLLEQQLQWDWHHYHEYLAALDGRLGVNAGGLVGHHAVRRWVMGDECAARPATDREIRAMAREVRAALRAGALGFSTDRNPRHRMEDGSPLPSHRANDPEFFALANEVARNNSGVVMVAGYPARPPIAWCGDLSLATGRPVLWQAINHHWHEPDAWRDELAQTAQQFERGARAYGITFALGITAVRGLGDPAPGFQELPTWDAILKSPSIEERKLGLSDPALRPRLRYEAVDDPTPTVFSKRWDKVYLFDASLPEHRRYLGQSVADIAQAQEKDVIDAFLDLSLKEDLRPKFKFAGIQGDHDAVAEMLRSPYLVIGESDAGAHGQSFACYGYTTWLLGYYVRERQALTLEEAVNGLTFKIASLYDLPDRGLLRAGYAADIVLFDPDRVGCREMQWADDMPQGYGRWAQPAEGIEMTLVNGEVLIEGGHHSGSLPGRVVRGRAAIRAGRAISLPAQGSRTLAASSKP